MNREPTEADRFRATFAQGNADAYYRVARQAHNPVVARPGFYESMHTVAYVDRLYLVEAQRRAAHHAAMARSMMGIEEYPV